MEEFKSIQLKNFTNILIALNILTYMSSKIIPNQFIELNFSLFSIESPYFKIWQYLSYGFLHGNFFHIFFNMLILLIFGSIIEQNIGKRVFIEDYFISIILTGVIYSFLFDNFRLIGASAGTYGLIIAFTYFWPRKYLFVFGIIPIQARFLVFGLLFFGFLTQIQEGNTSNIAHFAHIIGATVSFCYLELRFKKYFK